MKQKKKNDQKSYGGFTLVELLTVVLIIIILSATAIFFTNRARLRARDAQRATDILNMAALVENYKIATGSYPSTGSIHTVYMDPGCTITPTAPDTITAQWIPGVVPTYIGSLPRDPKPADQARDRYPAAACYMYASDGEYYIISAWATAETGPFTTGQLYSRAGYREANQVDQRYNCDHPNIGDAASGDYYQYSYTITNLPCTW